MADTEFNTDLTPEQKAELAESQPDILQLLESGNPLSEIAGRGMLTNWRRSASIGEEATEQAARVRAEVATQTPEGQAELKKMREVLRKVVKEMELPSGIHEIKIIDAKMNKIRISPNRQTALKEALMELKHVTQAEQTRLSPAPSRHRMR
jgi:hypothetical protein